MNKKAIFICGPTAVGKTAVAIHLAREFNTEIISFDSRQFYRELQIGAAPPSAEELSLVKHHLIGQRSVSEDYNAGNFEIDVLKILEDLFKSKDTVILVGGSGMYMQALTEGFDEMPDIPREIREKLNTTYRNKGLEPLVEKLKTLDPDYYEKVDRHNPQRIIRALEVIHTTGRAFTDFRKGSKANRNFDIIKIGLELPRPELYERINWRVDKMMEAGLETEVQELKPFWHSNALQTVGYKELIEYFNGKTDLTAAIEEIKKNSRRYAKRQISWFKRDGEIKWFSPFETEKIIASIKHNI